MSIDSTHTTDSLGGQTRIAPQTNVAVEGTIFPQAKDEPSSTPAPPAGSVSLGGQCVGAAHKTCAAEGHNSPQAKHGASPIELSPAGDHRSHPSDLLVPWPKDLDYDLRGAASAFSDIESLRIAMENRLRQFIRPRDELDKDGKNRGFGWTITHPAVEALAGQIEGILCSSDVLREVYGDKVPAKHAGCCLEHDAGRNLTRALRAHPLGAWIRSSDQKGIGEKQGARLVGILGDPYVRPEMKTSDGSVEPMRARTASELRAYCGYGEDRARPGRIQRRQRGQAANWSAEAKMRAHLIAESCKKSGLSKGCGCEKLDGDDFYTHSPGCQCSRYRVIYDRERARYTDAVHDEECVRCGPSGKPAAAGSPLSGAHKEGRALRRVAKEIVNDLWREARRIHLETPGGGHDPDDDRSSVAAAGD